MECGCYVLFLKDFFFCLLFSKLQEICNSRTCKRGCWPLFLKDVFLCCSFQNCSTQTLRNKSKYIRSSDEARGKCLISRTNRAWALSMRTSQKRGGCLLELTVSPFIILSRIESMHAAIMATNLVFVIEVITGISMTKTTDLQPFSQHPSLSFYPS